MNDLFRRFANKVSTWTGSPYVFVVATLIVIAWAFCGPLFNYSDTWQLVINTSTTIITFLMVFLIQNTQNRDGKATQIKLDELIRSNKNARNKFLDVENMNDSDLKTLHEEFCALQADYETRIKKIAQEREEREKSGVAKS